MYIKFKLNYNMSFSFFLLFLLIPTCVRSTIQCQVKLDHFGHPRPPRKVRQNLHTINRPHIEINSAMVLLLPTNTSLRLSLVTIDRQR